MIITINIDTVVDYNTGIVEAHDPSTGVLLFQGTAEEYAAYINGRIWNERRNQDQSTIA